MAWSPIQNSSESAVSGVSEVCDASKNYTVLAVVMKSGHVVLVKLTLPVTER